MVRANRLYNRIEPFCPVFGSRHCTRAYTAIGDPARWSGIPQPWYWHGTVRQGSFRFNLSEEVTPSSPLDVHTLCSDHMKLKIIKILKYSRKHPYINSSTQVSCPCTGTNPPIHDTSNAITLQSLYS